MRREQVEEETGGEEEGSGRGGARGGEEEGAGREEKRR